MSISAAWIMSASAVICNGEVDHLLVGWSPNMPLSSEKTRSAAAELGVNDPTVRMASAHLPTVRVAYASS